MRRQRPHRAPFGMPYSSEAGNTVQTPEPYPPTVAMGARPPSRVTLEHPDRVEPFRLLAVHSSRDESDEPRPVTVVIAVRVCGGPMAGDCIIVQANAALNTSRQARRYDPRLILLCHSAQGIQ